MKAAERRRVRLRWPLRYDDPLDYCLMASLLPATSGKIPTAFISYAHEGEALAEWMLHLGKRLRELGSTRDLIGGICIPATTWSVS